MVKNINADDNGVQVTCAVFDDGCELESYLKSNTGEIVAVQQVSEDEYYIHHGDYTLDNLGYEVKTEDGKVNRAFNCVCNSGTFLWGVVR